MGRKKTKASKAPYLRPYGVRQTLQVTHRWSIQIRGDRYVICSPYSVQWLAFLKRFWGCRWDPQLRCWSVPQEAVDFDTLLNKWVELFGFTPHQGVAVPGSDPRRPIFR